MVDFYGFGETPHPAYPLSLEDYSKSISNIIKFYKMEDVVLIGHSFGGRVAILQSIECNRIIGMILVDSAGIRPKRKLSYYYKVLKYKICKKIGIRNIKSGSDDYNKLNGAMKKTFVNIVNKDLTPYLNKITIATLIIWGENDKETPLYMAKKLNKYIKYSKLHILEGAGHYSYLDNYNQFIGIVKNFLDKVYINNEVF